ncbi:MAG: apolipoprotein N-acyltransferase [Treponema sp.]|jgi:apolipoprotein N-acyltransferase|nr:apolipoprotein N-acyltransferase [Treponema sp.]
MKNNNGWIIKILIHLGLIVLASILFAASFPNLLFKNGLPFLAWFAYIPILIVIRNNNLPACIGWGAIYGYTAYALFNYWLGAFHPAAWVITYTIYFVYLAVVFTLLKLAEILFQKRAYIVQWLIWLAYEYLCSLGFLGYTYGITGYSQWQMTALIQIASITGVWGVSALVTFPSFWLAEAINQHNGRLIKIGNALTAFFNKEKLSAIIWAVALCASLVFGIINIKDFSSYPQAQIALIQHNTDPWEADRAPVQWLITEAYRKDLRNLIRLSDEALALSPQPDLIVWPETAFIPRIYWHATYRDDPNSWPLVRELLVYLYEKETPFLIGNDDGRKEPAINPNADEKFRVDYNAALYFENGINTQLYRKIHLVPFTEHFPYKKQFPWIYNALKKADTHFWEKGDELTVFSGPGFSFSTPICFEDTFGYLARNFVRKGADVFINLSNDAWSASLPAQYQHLSIAVFRAVENFRPMVRATTSGQTCAIDPSGRVIAEAPPFTETILNVSIPLVTGTTIYTLYGDYLGIFFTFMAVILLLFGAVWYTIRIRRSDSQSLDNKAAFPFNKKSKEGTR